MAKERKSAAAPWPVGTPPTTRGQPPRAEPPAGHRGGTFDARLWVFCIAMSCINLIFSMGAVAAGLDKFAVLFLAVSMFFVLIATVARGKP